jgi:hypothetical protein
MQLNDPAGQTEITAGQYVADLNKSTRQEILRRTG